MVQCKQSALLQNYITLLCKWIKMALMCVMSLQLLGKMMSKYEIATSTAWGFMCFYIKYCHVWQWQSYSWKIAWMESRTKRFFLSIFTLGYLSEFKLYNEDIRSSIEKLKRFGRSWSLMLRNRHIDTNKHLLYYLSLLGPVFSHCQQDLAKSLNKVCTKHSQEVIYMWESEM